MLAGDRVYCPALSMHVTIAKIDGNEVWITYRWQRVARSERCSITQLVVR